MSNKLKLIAALLICLNLFWVFHLRDVESKQPMTIVSDGVANAWIRVAPDASDRVTSAAAELSACIEKRTGATVPVLKEKADPRPVPISIKTIDEKDPVYAGMKALWPDGFVIDTSGRDEIVISALTDSGAQFGVYEFLERFVGVRWLFPGPLGVDVPESPSFEVPRTVIREKPVFFSRQMSGFPNPVQRQWATHLRLRGHVRFSHNLNRIYPPQTYKKSHPGFFPLKNGQRKIPEDNRSQGWQPCLSADGIVDAAIKNICAYFEKTDSPRSYREDNACDQRLPNDAKIDTYSLGINDFGGFCECELCAAADSGQKNFTGYPDRSELYFKWANAVAEGVLARFPDKWFGCLAYDNLLEPPQMEPVHPRIIAFMTYDRMKWIDASVESIGHQVTRAWDKKTQMLGWYDYIYGSVYHVPRIYFHQMAGYYRFGADHGVSAVYAEACPNWGEGPKLYVAAKLMWNPYADVDQILNQWYERAVGKEAAPYLARYYTLWETFWTQRIRNTKWFTPRGQFLHFWLPDYLELVTFDDISESRRLLETAVEKARTPIHKKRARLLLRAFEYYEASAVSYLGLYTDTRQPGKSPAWYKMMQRKRKRLIDQFETDPVLVHPIRFDRKFSWADLHPFNQVGSEGVRE
ncbi:MAG: DUF4838 domain-containing protein [Desulfobacterales bacterium]|nr:DUF4838 domain-containing protein [Desulfobacterales bacterium]